MSKHNYNKIRTRQLFLITIIFFTVAFSATAETEQAQKNGRKNPFEVVRPVVVEEKQFEEIIVASVKEVGITPAQLQEAIQAALEAVPRQTLAQVQQEMVVIEPQEIIPEIFIQSVMLKFFRAENILPVVLAMLTEYGTAAIDAETNTLLICDSRKNLDKIIIEISKVDRTPQQILIEVVILDVQLSNDTELGVNWDNLFQLDGGFGSVSYVQSLNNLASGGSLTLINGRVRNTIKALQSQRDTEILASPRVLVLSGQEAYLETIEEIPYTNLTQTGSGGGLENPIASTEFKNAGITLTVKATVTDEGKILIEVEPDQSINTGVGGIGDTEVPIVDRRKIKTTLLMEDGQIVAIGGLRSKDIRESEDKIPLLGDLPFIGGLFSSKSNVVENSELLILISPHIYTGEDRLKLQEQAYWDAAKDIEPLRVGKKSSIVNELLSNLEILRKKRKK